VKDYDDGRQKCKCKGKSKRKGSPVLKDNSVKAYRVRWGTVEHILETSALNLDVVIDTLQPLYSEGNCVVLTGLEAHWAPWQGENTSHTRNQTPAIQLTAVHFI